MFTEKQWEHVAPWRQKELIVTHTVIPENKYGIRPGYYRDADIVALLRKHKKNPATVQFIADMME